VLLGEGIERLADNLAARYAKVTPVAVEVAGDKGVVLSVNGVRTVRDYAQVLSYMEGLDGVSRVAVIGVDANALQLAVEARTGQAVVAPMISLGRTLIRVPGASSLEYRLQP
jgi:hypothetical protein